MTSVTFPTALGGDGSTVSDDADPTTGLRNAGYKTRFVPALQQAINVVETGLNKAAAAAASEVNAANSAASALAQRNLAETAKTGAQQERIAAELARDEAEAFAGLAQATNPLEALQVNRAVITTNQTLAKGFNALSAGPIEIADGVTVTIEETSTWSIA